MHRSPKTNVLLVPCQRSCIISQYTSNTCPIEHFAPALCTAAWATLLPQATQLHHTQRHHVVPAMPSRGMNWSLPCTQVAGCILQCMEPPGQQGQGRPRILQHIVFLGQDDLGMSLEPTIPSDIMCCRASMSKVCAISQPQH